MFIMKKIFVIAFMLAASITSLFAQNNAQPADVHAAPVDPVITDIINSYLPWHSVEFNGKLKYEKLPVQPAVKMYMVCDSLLQISVRVPLLGEIGRLNLTRDELLVVNKHNRTYCRESADKLIEIYPGILNDIQSLFLARVVVLGAGQLGYENYEAVAVEEDREGDWMLIPASDSRIRDLSYGYIVGANSRTKAFVGALAGHGSLEIDYAYQNRGEQMTVKFESGKKNFEATLDFSSVKWGGSEMAPLKLDNYSRLSFTDFIRNLKKR